MPVCQLQNPIPSPLPHHKKAIPHQNLKKIIVVIYSRSENNSLIFYQNISSCFLNSCHHCSHNSATWMENHRLKQISMSLVRLVALLFTSQHALTSLSSLLSCTLQRIKAKSTSGLLVLFLFLSRPLVCLLDSSPCSSFALTDCNMQIMFI